MLFSQPQLFLKPNFYPLSMDAPLWIGLFGWMQYDDMDFNMEKHRIKNGAVLFLKKNNGMFYMRMIQHKCVVHVMMLLPRFHFTCGR
jgi:hypothetical protein